MNGQAIRREILNLQPIVLAVNFNLNLIGVGGINSPRSFFNLRDVSTTEPDAFERTIRIEYKSRSSPGRWKWEIGRTINCFRGRVLFARMDPPPTKKILI